MNDKHRWEVFKVLLIFFGLLLGFGSMGSVFAVERVMVLPNEISHISIPTRSYHELVVQGEFVNTCYFALEPQVDVQREPKVLLIKNEAMFQDRRMCLMVMVPYSHTLRMDRSRLESGSYRIVSPDAQGHWVDFGVLNND